jgi:hypothetical protein
VAIDDEIDKAGAVACVKEPGGRCDIEGPDDPRRSVIASSFATLRLRTVRLQAQLTEGFNNGDVAGWR